MEFECSMSNHLHRNVISVIEKRDLLFDEIVWFSHLELGRATCAEMLYRTNLIAYVPADRVTGLASNVGEWRAAKRGSLFDTIDSSECLWQSTENSCTWTVFQNFSCFNSNVTNKVGGRFSFFMISSFFILLSRLFVVLVNKILVFSFPTPCELLQTIETRENPRGSQRFLHHSHIITRLSFLQVSVK